MNEAIAAGRVVDEVQAEAPPIRTYPSTLKEAEQQAKADRLAEERYARDLAQRGQGAKYMEPLVFTLGLSSGKPQDGEWRPLPAPL